MGNQIERASEEIQRASEGAESNVREQLQQIANSLDEMAVEAEEDDPAKPHQDYLEEIEEKIVGLANETEEGGTTRPHLETARTHLDSYRRDHGIPREGADDADSDHSDDGTRADRG